MAPATEGRAAGPPWRGAGPSLSSAWGVERCTSPRAVVELMADMVLLHPEASCSRAAPVSLAPRRPALFCDHIVPKTWAESRLVNRSRGSPRERFTNRDSAHVLGTMWSQNKAGRLGASDTGAALEHEASGWRSTMSAINSTTARRRTALHPPQADEREGPAPRHGGP